MTYAKLGADRPAEVRTQLNEERDLLSKRGFFVQHHNWLLAQAFLELYDGNPQAAWEVIADGWRGYSGAFLDRVQQVRIDFLQTQGRAAVARAVLLDNPNEMLLVAERIVRKLRREHFRRSPNWAAALADMLQGGIWAVRGEKRPAIESLRTAAENLRAVDMKLFASASRYMLGALLDDEEGTKHISAAEREMRQLGVQNPGRMSNALVPGFADAVFR